MLSKERDLLYVYQQWSIPEALLNFQIVEQSLKEVIHCYHEIIKIRTRDIFSYKYSVSSIDDAAMGRLIDMFKVFHGDKEFIEMLKSVKNDRDYLAHKGYLAVNFSEKEKNLIQKEINKVRNMTDKSIVVLSRLRVIKSELQVTSYNLKCMGGHA